MLIVHKIKAQLYAKIRKTCACMANIIIIRRFATLLPAIAWRAAVF
ncbi:hypothetical protein GCWU000324_01132 [Kingella oralis ATCC 51147]|uniref:Uncharacterized protein n=1 Tax=Kingella oralis ATCC 51147 TaxID=629741 RepID=C4GG65_9NEIS|nr:hypothetical protein GCWU000324_01132 [Kingella oralis ATCC 51147]